MANKSTLIGSPRRALLPTAAAVSLSLTALATAQTLPVQSAASPASAPLSSTFYAIPAGPLAEVLRRIEQVGGVRLIADPASLQERESPAVQGQLTPLAAVQAALKGSGLTAIADGAAIRIGTAPQQLQTVVVFARRDPAEYAFKAGLSDTAVRSRADVMDVPGSITMLTANVLESKQVLDVREALASVSGISVQSNPQGGASYTVRGFDQGDGLVNGLSGGATADLQSIERIEVLKGPQAILSGPNGLGGVVNVVLKKPSAETFRSATVQYGSFADKTVALDSTSAIDDEKQWSYRLNAAVTRAGQAPGGYGYAGRRADSLLPQLRFKNGTTDLTLTANWTRNHQPVPAYTLAVDGVIQPKPRLPLSNSGDGVDIDGRSLSYALEHALGDRVTLVSRVSTGNSTVHQHAYIPLFAMDPGYHSVLYVPGVQTQDGRGTSGDHYVRLQFATGPLEHRMSVGFNHSRTATVTHQFTGGDAADGLLVDPFGSTPTVFPPLGGSESFTADAVQRNRAVYMQDLIEVGDLSLSLGLRRDRFSSGATGQAGGTILVDDSFERSVTTPNVGVIYRVQPAVALYAAYSEGFVPIGGLGCDNVELRPQSTRNKEFGVKFDLLGGKLGATLSAFQLDLHNVPLFDAARQCQIQVQAQTNTGLEFDLQGQIARGWNVLASLSHTTITAPADFAATIASAGQPKNKASLWTTYDLSGAMAQGWTIGAGLAATGRSEGSRFAATRFQVPGSVRVDASASLARERWTVAFGVKDLFDASRYEPATTNTFVPLSRGRTATVTARLRFD